MHGKHGVSPGMRSPPRITLEPAMRYALFTSLRSLVCPSVNFRSRIASIRAAAVATNALMPKASDAPPAAQRASHALRRRCRGTGLEKPEFVGWSGEPAYLCRVRFRYRSAAMLVAVAIPWVL